MCTECRIQLEQSYLANNRVNIWNEHWARIRVICLVVWAPIDKYWITSSNRQMPLFQIYTIDSCQLLIFISNYHFFPLIQTLYDLCLCKLDTHNTLTLRNVNTKHGGQKLNSKPFCYEVKWWKMWTIIIEVRSCNRS